MGILNFVERLDYNYSSKVSSLLPAVPKLLSFYFHGIFKDEKELHSNLMHPQQKFTVENFRMFFEYFLNKGYKFINPEELNNDAGLNKKNILMTFDDGNFSNHLILPLLNEYKIPAIFFIPTIYTKTQKAFWVDVLYRNRIKQGVDESKMWEEIVFLKKSNHIEIEKYLIQNFGANSLKPLGDIDRPFNTAELKEFAKQKFVYIGNHTLDHVSLPHYSEDDIRNQVRDNQKDLFEITGMTPDCIAFPYGDYSDNVVKVTEELGFKFAYTTVHKSNPLPLKATEHNLKLVNRFTISMQPDISKRFDYLISDYKIIDGYYNLRRTFMRR